MSITTLLRSAVGRAVTRQDAPAVYEPYPPDAPVTAAAIAGAAEPAAATRRRAHWTVPSDRVVVPDDDLHFV